MFSLQATLGTGVLLALFRVVGTCYLDQTLAVLIALDKHSVCVCVCVCETERERERERESVSV